MLGAIIKKIQPNTIVKALFLKIMKFISPFYDENSRRRLDLKYKNISVEK